MTYTYNSTNGQLSKYDIRTNSEIQYNVTDHCSNAAFDTESEYFALYILIHHLRCSTNNQNIRIVTNQGEEIQNLFSDIYKLKGIEPYCSSFHPRKDVIGIGSSGGLFNVYSDNV